MGGSGRDPVSGSRFDRKSEELRILLLLGGLPRLPPRSRRAQPGASRAHRKVSCPSEREDVTQIVGNGQMVREVHRKRVRD